MSSSEAAAASASRGRTWAGSAWPFPLASAVSTSATSGSVRCSSAVAGGLHFGLAPLRSADKVAWGEQNGSQ